MNVVSTSMFSQNKEREFPLHCIPQVIKNAIIGVSSKTKAPLPLIFASAMAPVSLLCQGLIDIHPAKDVKLPVSCNFCTVAESGERKSTVDKFFMSPIYDYEQQALSQYEHSMIEFTQELDTWTIELNALKNILKTLIKRNKPTDEIKQRIKLHWTIKPQSPNLIKLVANDITPAALQHLLYTGGGSISLHSAEGDIILGGQAIQNLGLLNDLWDGSPVSVIRRQTESYTINNARLSANIMVQDAPLRKYFRRSQEQARGSGFLSRFFFSRPESTIGSRIGHTLDNYHELLSMYHFRITELLNSYTEKVNKNEQSDREILKFTPEAALRWKDMCDYFEEQMSERGSYYYLRDFASKESNKLARLSALFHYFNGDEGDIPEQTLLDAQKISEWYLNEALYLFETIPEQPQYIQDGEMLWEWLNDRFLDNQGEPLMRSWISPRVPNKLRQPGRLEPALQYLVKNKLIYLWYSGRRQFISPLGY